MPAAKRLLLVDDDDAMRRLVRLNLADSYEVIDTNDPEQALALALEHRPDAILMDLHMPKFSGLELCRTFSSISKTQPIPIFVVSGAAGVDAKESCREMGAAGYFEKPVDFDALRACLAKVQRQSRVPLREVRVQLRVELKLCGTDTAGQEFSERTFTEDVSLSGFLCGCAAELEPNSVVDVYLVSSAEKYVGKARAMRSEQHPPAVTRYGFRFVEKKGEWILR